MGLVMQQTDLAEFFERKKKLPPPHPTLPTAHFQQRQSPKKVLNWGLTLKIRARAPKSKKVIPHPPPSPNPVM